MHTKYFFFVALLFSAISYSTSAQDFVAGPLAGMSFSQVDGDFHAGFHKPGINIGGFVYRPISENWDIQMEIAYTQKGSRKKPNYDNNDYTDYEINLQYIQIPLLAKFHYKSFSAEAGVSIGSLLASEELWEGSPLVSDDEVPFKDMEYATLFGVNYHINKRLWVNVRWSYSINRIRIPYNGEIPIYEPKKHWLSRKTGQYNNNVLVSVYFALNQVL